SMGILQVKLRLIVKNGDYYIVFPTNEYAKFSSSGTNAISGLGDIGEVGKLIADNIGDIFYNPEESLKYDGLISQAGQYCESYVDENGNKVNFYFNNGLQKIEFVDSSGKRVTQNVSLVAGTKKQSVSMFDSIFGAQPFEIPRTATEIKDESKLQSLLGGMGFPIDDMFN
ncbi:MAG: hypothetical protein FWF05_04125, partial [Oscillospiraceae bacterium]|nr:hypothetical protein [Oscillospiraceae bacterium]